MAYAQYQPKANNLCANNSMVSAQRALSFSGYHYIDMTSASAVADQAIIRQLATYLLRHDTASIPAGRTRPATIHQLPYVSI